MAVICFKIHPEDNVATLLTDASSGTLPVRGTGGPASVVLTEAIELGHKVALCDIAVGGAIVKFGVPIGTASQTIGQGAWVHLHNCRSNFDSRSASFDVHSGATTDTKYE